jgi:hypothetical protein
MKSPKSPKLKFKNLRETGPGFKTMWKRTTPRVKERRRTQMMKKRQAESPKAQVARIESRAARLSRLQEAISSPHMSFEKIAILTKKELQTDRTEQEKRQRAELDVAKPVEPADNDLKGDKADIDAGSIVDRISSPLHANTVWNRIVMERINVKRA